MPTPPSRGAVSSPYGMRINPNDGKYRMHYGEDTLGVGNFSPVNGTVVFSGWDSTGTGLGYAVGVRESANPSVIWWIAHHASLAVHVGQTVSEGLTKLGEKGATGAAKGVHCHTERRVGGAARPGSGTPTNPRAYYTNTAGGDTEPFPSPGKEPIRKNMTQVIMTTFTAPLLDGDPRVAKIKSYTGGSRILNFSAGVSVIALVGDSPGTPANVQVTQVDARGNQWAADNSGSWESIDKAARPYDLDEFISLCDAYLTPLFSSGGGGLTPTQDSALMSLPAAIDDLPTKGELGQALTSTVALVNEHADDNKGEVIQAIDGIPGGSGSSNYDLTLNIDSVPGTATGTAAPQ